MLLGRERRNHEANAETVAKVIAERRRLPSPDSDCRLLAAVGMLLVERALNAMAVDSESRARRPGSAGVRGAAVGVEVDDYLSLNMTAHCHSLEELAV